MDNTCSDASDIAIEGNWLSIFEVTEVVTADAKLTLTSSAPAKHLSLLAERKVVTGAASDIDDNVIDEAFHKFGRHYNSVSSLFTLLAVEEVLAPLVNASRLRQAQRVVSTTLDFGDCKPLSK